jgi:phosphate starvation-inducible protein PhoH
VSAKKTPAATLEFDDNKLLRALGGPHAKHFARIEQDVVRHPLVARIVAAYNRHGKS